MTSRSETETPDGRTRFADDATLAYIAELEREAAALRKAMLERGADFSNQYDKLKAENRRLAAEAESLRAQWGLKEIERHNAELAALEAKEALGSAWAAIGDRLLAKGPLDIAYAHAVSREIRQAQSQIDAALAKWGADER